MDFKKLPWIKISSLAVAALLIVLVWGCEVRAPGLTDPTRMMTRQELQIEFDALIASYEYRLATLEQKERFRNLLLQNAGAIAQTGQVNPFSIVWTILAFYGAGSAATSTKNTIKKVVTR